jgi:hypothetical protein
MIGEIDWRHYYDDGSTFNSAQGGPEDVPPDGVLAIIQLSGEHRNKRDIVLGWDCYFFHPERKLWVGADHMTIIYRLKQRRPVIGLCDGIGTFTEDYQSVISQGVVRDTDFPGAELGLADAIDFLERSVKEGRDRIVIKHASEIARRAGMNFETIQEIILPTRPVA